jgi:hypothetical protein
MSEAFAVASKLVATPRVVAPRTKSTSAPSARSTVVPASASSADWGLCFMSSPLLPFVPLVAIVLRARAYASSLPLRSKIATLGARRHHAASRDMAAIVAAIASASLTRTFRDKPFFGSFRHTYQA